MRRADRVEQPDERLTIFRAQSFQRVVGRALRDRIDLLEHGEPSRRNPTEMLPPAFCALAGIADNATPNPATRNIRASALERIAAFMDVPSAVSSVRYAGS